MRTVFLLLLVGAVGAPLVTYGLPWWWLCVPALVVGAAFGQSSQLFWKGFLAGAVVWVGHALVLEFYSATNFAAQMAELLQFRSVPVLFAAVGLLGGLTTGLATGLGAQLRRAAQPKTAR